MYTLSASSESRNIRIKKVGVFALKTRPKFQFLKYKPITKQQLHKLVEGMTINLTQTSMDDH